MDNFNEESQSEDHNTPSERSSPDYIAMQYRQIRVENGWKTRKERIGVAFDNENGSICFRLTGRQIIEGDIYLFPSENSHG